jgi:hypothetical protein
MKTEIIAPIAGKIVLLTTGIVAVGSTLFTIEFMKMNVIEKVFVPGLFEAAVIVGVGTTAALVVGTEVFAGDIIGYFTSTDEG